MIDDSTLNRIRHRLSTAERERRRVGSVAAPDPGLYEAAEERYAAAIEDARRDFSIRLHERDLVWLLASDEELQAVEDAAEPGDAYRALRLGCRARWAAGERPSAEDVWRFHVAPRINERSEVRNV